MFEVTTLMDDNEIRPVETRLLNYLRHHTDVHGALDEQTDLLAGGILDSLLITDLVVFIRTAFGVELTAYDISPAHLCTIACMARLVHDKRHKARRAG
jgi:acyl carrier protein